MEEEADGGVSELEVCKEECEVVVVVVVVVRPNCETG
jgi:hypothetical protein